MRVDFENDQATKLLNDGDVRSMATDSHPIIRLLPASDLINQSNELKVLQRILLRAPRCSNVYSYARQTHDT